MGTRQVTEPRARWLGHKLHVDVAITVGEGLLLAEARNISETLGRELSVHIPALSVAQVRLRQQAPDHAHAPVALRVDTARPGVLSSGEIAPADPLSQ